MKILKKVDKDEFLEFLYDIDLTDKKMYDELNTNNYVGIFQFTGSTASKLVEKIKPQDFEEMVAVNCLARPGTIDFADQYLYNKEHPEHLPYPKQVCDLLEKTHKTLLQQEQIMAIFNKIGGFSLESTNGIRGLMKKLGKADKKPEDLKKWDEAVQRFSENAIQKGITKSEARKIADDLLVMSGYSFNRSHAVAYTYNAIMTLYLSVYFRIYFYSALLTYEVERKGNLLEVLNTIKNKGITVLPPDINKSKETFSLFEDKAIIFGLQDIKFVGEKPTASILENRPYTSLLDFILKTKINKNVLFALIKVGCFDVIDNNRAKLFYIATKFHEEKKTIKVEEKLRAIYERVENTASLLNITTTHKDLIEYEKEYFDFNFFNSIFHPELVAKFIKMKERGLINRVLGETSGTSTKVPVIVNKVRSFNDKNGNPMAFLEVEDMSGEVRSIPIFQSYWKYLSEVINTSEVYLINFFINEDGELMFGSNRWIRDEDKIRGLVKHISQP